MSRDTPQEIADGITGTLESIYNNEVVPLLNEIGALTKEVEWYRKTYNDIYRSTKDNQ